MGKCKNEVNEMTVLILRRFSVCSLPESGWRYFIDVFFNRLRLFMDMSESGRSLFFPLRQTDLFLSSRKFLWLGSWVSAFTTEIRCHPHNSHSPFNPVTSPGRVLNITLHTCPGDRGTGGVTFPVPGIVLCRASFHEKGMNEFRALNRAQ